MRFLGDPILPGVEWQSEKSSLYLYPGETELSHYRDQLQTVCTAGGRRRADLSAQQHIGGGKLIEILVHAAKQTYTVYWILVVRMRGMQETTLPHTGRGQETEG